MCLESRSPVRVLPSPVIVRAGDALFEFAKGLVIRMCKEVMPMQHDFGLSEKGNEGANARSIAAQSGVGASYDLMNVKAVCVRESLLQIFPRYLESDEMQIRRRCKGRVSQLIDVKCKLRSNVAMRALAVSHGGAKLVLQLRKVDGCRRIDRLRMTDRIS